MGKGTTYLENPFTEIAETNAADYGSGLAVGRGQISPDAPPAVAGGLDNDTSVIPGLLDRTLNDTDKD